MKHKLFTNLVFLIALIILWTASATEAATFDFSNGFANWKKQNAEIKSTPLGNRYCTLFFEKATAQSVARIYSPKIAIPQKPENTKRTFVVTFKYRCDISDSRMHYGAWVIVFFNGKKNFPFQGFPLQKTDGWQKRSLRGEVPAGAVLTSLQFRLQGHAGRFDIDDIQISFSENDKPKLVDGKKKNSGMDYSNLILADEFKLQDGKNGKVLQGTDTTLTDCSKRTGLPFAFVLPAKYCNRKDLIYEVETVVEPAWNGKGKNHKSMSVFTLGRNMSGGIMPNSISFIFWGGKMPFCRMTSSTGNDKIDIKNPHSVILVGKDIVLKFRWNNKNISMKMGNKEFGPATVFNEFSWPEERPFYIGGENAHQSIFNGKIKNFVLRIYKPQIKCHLTGGEKAVYFYGAGPHRQMLAFQNKIGKLCASELTVVDIDGKVVVEKLSPAEKTDSSHLFTLPPLPFGWYTIIYSIKRGKYIKSFLHSMVIMPRKPEREPAVTSPFGLATESLKLTPDDFDVDKMEQEFSFLAAAGMRWIRPMLPWHDIEWEQGQYRWEGLDAMVDTAEKHGLSICLMMVGGTRPFQSYLHKNKPAWYVRRDRSIPKDMKAWENYLRALATRYKGRINHYQIGGEPDTRCAIYPFDTGMYVDWLKKSSVVLHDVDSRNKVSMGGFCVALEGDFLNKKSHTNDDSAFGGLEFYNLKPHDALDFITVHLYSCGNPGQAWEPAIPIVKKMKDFLNAQGEGAKPIWDTEVSFTTGIPGTLGGFSGRDPLISEQTQAWRLVQLYIQSAAVGIEKTFWYLSRGYAGFMYTDYFPKPAFASLSVLTEQLKKRQFSKALYQDDGLSVYEFQGETGYLYVVWTSFGSGSQYLILNSKGNDAKISVSDIMGNVKQLEYPQEYAVRAFGEAPTYITSKREIAFSKLFNVNLSKALVENTPFPVTVTLHNPADKLTTFTIGACAGKLDGIKETLSLQAGKSKTITLQIPAAKKGTLEIECQAQGGFNRRFSMKIPLRFRKSVLLKKDREATLQINTEEQVQFGGVKQLMGIVDGHSNWKGAKDASAEIKLKRNGRNIQFTIKVRDNKLVSAPEESKALYDWDCVELFIAFPGKEGDRISQYVFAPDGRSQAYGKKHPLKSTVEKTDNGYVVRGSFTLPDDVKDHFMFDLILDDADDKNGYKTRMVWAGSGQDNPAKTENYGMIMLE